MSSGLRTAMAGSPVIRNPTKTSVTMSHNEMTARSNRIHVLMLVSAFRT